MTASSTHATPEPCSECACPPSPMLRSRARPTLAFSGCDEMSTRAKEPKAAAMITRVLVANRGEIARRIFATCRRLGLSTVAVYTEPDATAPHVAEADARVRLPGTDGYLNIPALIGAAKSAGADAIH